MQTRAAQIVATVILLVCLGCHVSELFDRWDHALQTGNDIESVLVVIALVAGVVLIAGRVLAALLQAKPIPLHLQSSTTCETRYALPICSGSSSPLALRI